MTRITVDAGIAQQFRLAANDAVVVDPAGNVLGKFTPEQPPNKAPYQHITDEEFKRRLREESGRSLSEFWKSMGQS